MEATAQKKADDSVGALWVKENDKGTFLSMKITLGGQEYSLIGFNNKYKEAGDNRPDYRLFISKQKPQI
jgi:hypothetical protein